MILRELRRFLLGSRLLGLTGACVLAVGVGSSAVAVSMLLAFSSLRYPGMRSQGYATVGEGESGGVVMPISWSRYEELRQARRGELRIAAYTPAMEADLSWGSAHPLQARVAAVSDGFFSGFTVPLAAGRDFTSDEAEGGGQRSAILSAELAKSAFGSPQGALGRRVFLKGDPYFVVGVAPPSFHGLFGDHADAWVSAKCVNPLLMDLGVGPEHSALWKVLSGFFVLTESDSVSSGRLASDLNHRLPLRVSGNSPLGAVQGISFDAGRDETLRHWLRLGLGFSLGFALVGCMNVCLLLLARAPLLIEEVRLKTALGANAKRIFIELAIGPGAMMVAGFGAALLLWIAAMAVIARVSSTDGELLAGSAGAVLGALAAQVALAVAVALFFALIPAVAALRASLIPRMGVSATAGRRAMLLTQAPAILQVSCAIGAWVLAGMIVSSVLSTLRQPLGYDPAHRQVISIWIAHGSLTIYGSAGATTEYLALNDVIKRLESIPGVRGVSYVSCPPLVCRQTGVESLQNVEEMASVPRATDLVIVTPGYFHTVGARMLVGRDVSSWINTGATNEIVLNEVAAKELFPGENPVHRTVDVLIPPQAGIPSRRYPAIIVGVVENMRTEGYASSPQPAFFEDGHAHIDGMPNLVVWGDESAGILETTARKIVPELMPGMEVRKVFRLEEEANESLAPEKDRALAALACALSMAAVSYIGYIGLYGSLTFYLRSRRREMAVRLCLGASPGRIRGMVFALALRCALAAAILSVPMLVFLERLSASDLLGPVSWSPGRAVAIAVACILATVLSASIPAAAAASISPAGTLKEQ